MASLDYLLAELATRYGALVGDYGDDPNVHTTPASVGCIPGQTILIDTHSSPEKAYFKNSAGVWVAFGTGSGGGGGSGNMNYAGTWDMTPTVTPTPCLPDPTRVAGCSVNVSNPHAVLVSPTAPQVSIIFGSAYACFLGSTAIALDGNEQQVSLVQPTIVGGDTIGESVLFFTNSGATLADVEATLAGAAITGTCKFITMVFNSGGTEIEETIAAAGFGVGTMGLSIAGGSPIYVGVNTTTGALSAGNGTGALTAITGTTIPLSDIPGGESLRMYVGAIGSASTPIYAAGALSFDFSSTHGGAEGLGGSTSSDPVTPVGATDYSLYKVTAPGSFGGTSAKTGDIVMLYGTMNHVFVFRPPTNITEYTTPAEVTSIVATSISSGAIGTAIAAAITAAESGAIASAIAAAISSAESGAIATAIASAVSTGVAGETSRAEGAETTLQTNIDTVQTNLNAVDAYHQGVETTIAAEITALGLATNYTKDNSGAISINLTAGQHRYGYTVNNQTSSNETIQIFPIVAPTDGDIIEILAGRNSTNYGMKKMTVEFQNGSGGTVTIDKNAPVSNVSTALFELGAGRITLIYKASNTNWEPSFLGDAGYSQNGSGTQFTAPGIVAAYDGQTIHEVGDAPFLLVDLSSATLAALTLKLAKLRLRQTFRVGFMNGNVTVLDILNGDNSGFTLFGTNKIVASSGALPTSVASGDVLEFYCPEGVGIADSGTVFYIGKTNYSV